MSKNRLISILMDRKQIRVSNMIITRGKLLNSSNELLLTLTSFRHFSVVLNTMETY